MNYYKARLAVVLAVLSICWLSIARGQVSTSTTAGGGSTAADADDLALPEVTVSARKVTERLQDVPISVTSVSGLELQQESADKLADVAQLTPGLVINEGLTPGQTVFNIRGQDQTSVNASTDPSVGIYVDGLYWARAIGANTNLLDLQDVQVLRGPQGTLFGRNTTGGAILLQSNDPNFEGVSGVVSATYGRFDDRSATAVVNLPVVPDLLAVRVAFTGDKRDGYIEDAYNGLKLDNENTWSGRFKALWTPMEHLSVLLSAELYEDNVFSNPYRAIYVDPTSAANLEAGIEQYGAPVGPTGVGQRFVQGSALLDSYVARSANSDTIFTNVPQTTFSRTQTFSSTVKWDTAVGVVKFIGGYRGLDSTGNTDLDGTPYSILFSPYIQKVHQVSGELQITGNALSDALKFASGLFYFHESGRDDTPLVALPDLNPDNPTIYDGNVRTDSKGIYGQATYHITDSLSVTGGLRYSSETRGVTIYNRSFDAATDSFACLLSTAVTPICAASRQDPFSNVSYTAGLDYKFAENILGYFKTDKGFRSGGENLKSAGTLVAFQPFLPETTVSYELGLKSEFYDHRLRVNADTYFSTTTNLQQQTVVSSPNGTASNVIGNAGKARITGVELEVSERVTRDFRVSISGANTDARYVSYIDPNTGANLSNYFFDAPRFTASSSGIYTHDFGFGNYLARVDYSWTDTRRLAPYNNIADPFNQEKIDAFTAAAVSLVNLRTSISILQDHLELAAYCRNVTDNRGKVVVEVLPDPLGIVIGERRQPRFFGLTATYRFRPSI